MTSSASFSAARVFLDGINVRALELFEERAKGKLSSCVQYVPDNDSSTRHSAEVFLQDVIENVVTAISSKLSLLPSVNHQLSYMDKQISGDCESHRETIAKGGNVSSFISSGWSLEQKMKLEDEIIAQKASAHIEGNSLSAEFEEIRLSNVEGPFLKTNFEDSKGKKTNLQQDPESQFGTVTTRNKLSVSNGPLPNDSDMQILTEGSDTVTFKPARELFEANSQEKGNLNSLPSSEDLSEIGQCKSRKFNYFTGDSNVSLSLKLHATTESHSCRVVESHRGSDIESIKKDGLEMKDDVLDANVDDLRSFVGEDDQAVPGAEEDTNIEKTGHASLYDLNIPSDDTEADTGPLGSVVTGDAENCVVPLSYQWFAETLKSNNEAKPSDRRLTKVHPIPSCNRRRRVGLSRNQRVRPLHFKRLKMSEE